MGNTVLHCGGIFPDGTSVKAYRQIDVRNHAERGEAPSIIAAIETQTVSSGVATFTTLIAGQPYLFYAKAGAGASSVAVATAGDGTHDEVDVVTLRGFDGQAITGGTFTLTVTVTGGTGAATTAALAWDASATDVQKALENLADLAPGDITVTGSRGGPYTLTYGGTVTHTAITTAVNAAGLTGATKHNYVLAVGAA